MALQPLELIDKWCAWRRPPSRGAVRACAAATSMHRPLLAPAPQHRLEGSCDYEDRARGGAWAQCRRRGAGCALTRGAQVGTLQGFDDYVNMVRRSPFRRAGRHPFPELIAWTQVLLDATEYERTAEGLKAEKVPSMLLNGVRRRTLQTLGRTATAYPGAGQHCAAGAGGRRARGGMTGRGAAVPG